MAEIDNQGGFKFGVGDALEMLDFFSKKISERGGILGWFKRLFCGDAGPGVKGVIGLPVAVAASDGKVYVRLYLLRAARMFGKGRVVAIPRIRVSIFPHVDRVQVYTEEVDGIEDRFPEIGEMDPFYRIILTLPAQGGAEICKRIFEAPNTMGALVSGHIDIEKNGKKVEVLIVPLNLAVGGGQMLEHQGPLVRPKES